MKIILLGATGMIGQGVLREALTDPTVEHVLSIGRTPTGQQHDKLEELAPPDLAELSAYQSKLAGYDACLFCLGVSSGGLSEEAYRKITLELTVAVARVLCAANPAMSFLYISGKGTDSTEKGRSMWARVKGQTENALLALPFKSVYMLRPGAIQPQHGIRSKTRSYRVMYALLWPFLVALRPVLPNTITTTDRLSRAMLRIAREGTGKRILETRDINALAKAG
jgi:uncharacterized protein YbjT (DUF2867 family)